MAVENADINTAQTHEMFITIFKKGVHITKANMTCMPSRNTANLSEIEPAILSPLITSAGRFAENYASDLMMSWRSFTRRVYDAVDICIEHQGCSPIELIEVFAVRRHGVDHENFVFSRMSHKTTFEEAGYRQVIVLYATVSCDKDCRAVCSFELKDCTDVFWPLTEI